MKNGVIFRFRSWALIPTETNWSNWTHCERNTMMEFLKCLQRVDEMSSARLSPDYESKYRVVSEVQCIVNASDESWTWTPADGWHPTPQTAEDIEFDKAFSGKGKRPPKKTATERAADRERELAEENEIFGTPPEQETLDEPAPMKSMKEIAIELFGERTDK